MDIQNICAECRFWDTEGGPVYAGGVCRRHAPRPSETGDATWVRTSPDDWCGEFELRVKVVDRAEIEERYGSAVRATRENRLESAPDELEVFRKVVLKWEAALRDADLHEHTKYHYTNHPKRVLRWLEGTYRLRPKRQEE